MSDERKSGKPLWQNRIFRSFCHNDLPRVQGKRYGTSLFVERSADFLTARLYFRNQANGKPLWQWLSTKLNCSSVTSGKPLWQSCHTFLAKHTRPCHGRETTSHER